MIYMGTVTLSCLLLVISLLHVTYGNLMACSTKITGIPPDLNQINGAWSAQLVSTFEDFSIKKVPKVISKISANEKEANISIIFNLAAPCERTTRNERVHGDTGTLSYQHKDTLQSVIIIQPNMSSMIVYFQEKDVCTMAVLYSKEISLPESEVNHFKEWSKCKNLQHFKKIKSTINQGLHQIHNWPITIANPAAVSCTDMEEKLNPLSIKKSLGRWNLVVSAHSQVLVALMETAALRAALGLRIENDKYHMTALAILANYPVATDFIVIEKDGYVTYSGSDKPIFRHFSQDCAVASSPTWEEPLYLACRTEIPSALAMNEFANYAISLNHTHIIFRREPASSCLDIPPIVTSPDLQRISGKWKVVAVASFIPKEHSPTEIEFSMDDQQLVLSSDKGIKTTMEKRFDAFYDITDGEILLKFHKSPEKSLLFWIGSKWEGRAALYLLSKHSTADPVQSGTFRLFASCLSMPHVNVKSK